MKDGDKEQQTAYTEKDRQKMKLIFFRGHPVVSALQIAKIPFECVPGLKGDGVGTGEQGMGLRYLGFGTLCFFFPPTPPPLPPRNVFFFSVCIKCQVNFLGAMRDVSSPSVCVAGR